MQETDIERDTVTHPQTHSSSTPLVAHAILKIGSTRCPSPPLHIRIVTLPKPLLVFTSSTTGGILVSLSKPNTTCLTVWGTDLSAFALRWGRSIHRTSRRSQISIPHGPPSAISPSGLDDPAEVDPGGDVEAGLGEIDVDGAVEWELL
jgi:hypothetical protein